MKKTIFAILVALVFGAVHTDGKMKVTAKAVTHVTLTCYQPVKSQCDSSPLITADGSKIDLRKLEQGKIRWCAVSKDIAWLLRKHKSKRIHIQGFGIYEVRDRMNPRFGHRIDILIHPDDDTRFKLDNVKVSIL